MGQMNPMAAHLQALTHTFLGEPHCSVVLAIITKLTTDSCTSKLSPDLLLRQTLSSGSYIL